MKITFHAILCGVALWAAFALAGCGGSRGSGGSSSSARPRLEIVWAARTRSVNAPSSALSANIVIVGVSPGFYGFSKTVNRPAGKTETAEIYEIPISLKTGVEYPFEITFFDSADGEGAEVARANATATLQAGGMVSTVRFTTVSEITGVDVMPNQWVAVGKTKTLKFAARTNNAVEIAAGAPIFNVVSGREFLTVDSAGALHGVAGGTATVTVTVDGKISAETPVFVEAADYLIAPEYTITPLPPQHSPVAVSHNGSYILMAKLTGPSVYDLYKDGNLTPIEVPGGAAFNAVNSSGQVAGSTLYGNPLVWQNGQVTELPRPANLESVFVTAINDNGQVAGIGTSRNAPNTFLFWQNGQIEAQPPLPPDLTLSGVLAVNSSGQVLLSAIKKTSPPQYVALLWNDRQTQILGDFEPRALNDRGQVAGLSSPAPQFAPSKIYLWENGQVSQPTDFFPGINNNVQINDSGLLINGSRLFYNGRDIFLEERVAPGALESPQYAFLLNDGRVMARTGGLAPQWVFLTPKR